MASVVCLQSLVPARFETRTATGLVKGHAYSLTAVEEVKPGTHMSCSLVCVFQHCRHTVTITVSVRGSPGLLSKTAHGVKHGFSEEEFTRLLFSRSANRLSTRTPNSVWCVSGTRGVKWSGKVPGVTSNRFILTIKSFIVSPTFTVGTS